VPRTTCCFDSTTLPATLTRKPAWEVLLPLLLKPPWALLGCRYSLMDGKKIYQFNLFSNFQLESNFSVGKLEIVIITELISKKLKLKPIFKLFLGTIKVSILDSD
jgi:hypothetical protein